MPGTLKEVGKRIISKTGSYSLTIGTALNGMGIIMRHVKPIVALGTNTVGWIIASIASLVEIGRLSHKIRTVRKGIDGLAPRMLDGLQSPTPAQVIGMVCQSIGIVMFGTYLYFRYDEHFSKESHQMENNEDMVIGTGGLCFALLNHLLCTTYLENLLDKCKRQYQYLRRADGLLTLINEAPRHSSYWAIGEQLRRKLESEITDTINVDIILDDNQEEDVDHQVALRDVLSINDEEEFEAIHQAFRARRAAVQPT